MSKYITPQTNQIKLELQHASSIQIPDDGALREQPDSSDNMSDVNSKPQGIKHLLASIPKT